MVTERKRDTVSSERPGPSVQTETDKIVADALNDERRERREKMEQTRGVDVTGDYLSDSDVGESEDEGDVMEKKDDVIQEDMVDVAHAKRQALRKGKGMDVGLVEDIEQAEEGGYEIGKDVEKEHGIALEAFNLVEERERGYFDDEGNYVERATGKEDEGEEDAWLDDGQDKEIVDEVTRRKIEDRMKEEEEIGDLSAVDIARIQYKISKVLQDGESVAVALKRLAGPLHRRKGAVSAEDKVLFDSLTDYATTLLDAGETDVYSKDREYFQRAASVYIDLDDDLVKKMGQSLPSQDEESEDMFASDSEAPPEKKRQKKQGTEFSTWPIKEIKRFCEEHGKTCAGMTEKEELIQLACQVEQDLSERVVQKTASTHGAIFDPRSGHWISQDGLFYWDETQQSWQPTTNQKTH